MDYLTVRDLSRGTAAALDRVERGESLEVRRGKRPVARLIPAVAVGDRREIWAKHFAWLKGRKRRRNAVDPVDELIAERSQRTRRLG